MADEELQPVLPTLTHGEIEEWRKEESGDHEALKMYRKYAEGDQDHLLSSEQMEIMGQMQSKPMADNVLSMIINTAASRLEFEGWKCDAQEVEDYLDRLWFMNQMEDLQYQNTRATLRDGNRVVSLRWKPSTDPEGGRVTLHQERWWDGKEGIFVGYIGDQKAWAVKEWEPVKDKVRRTVYYPDRIERFIRDGNGWSHVRLASDPPGGQDGIIQWTRKGEGNIPLGLPLVHFRNGKIHDTPYGVSDIAGLLALQDDLNMLQRDMAVAAAYAGFQLYALIGGKMATGFKPSPGSVVEVSNAAGDFKAVSAGSMRELRETHAYKRQTIGVDSSTPIHLITGADWPSGNALLRAETPLVDKVKMLARVFGPAYVEVAHRATEIVNTFGKGALDEAAKITAIFAPPERLDEQARIEAAQARANLFVLLEQIPDKELIGMLDIFSQSQLDEYWAAREKREKEAAALAESIAQAQNQGAEGEQGDQSQADGAIARF